MQLPRPNLIVFLQNRVGAHHADGGVVQISTHQRHATKMGVAMLQTESGSFQIRTMREMVQSGLGAPRADLGGFQNKNNNHD